MIEHRDIAGIGMTSQRTRDRLVQRLKDRGISQTQILEVIASLPRHLFLEPAMSHQAYSDTALPIGFGQTISQPYIVARMTQLLLERGPLKRVLEVGTGSGYQTAVLSKLVSEVYTVERIYALHVSARRRLSALRCHNVQFLHSDGNNGWSSEAPFDGIIVTAAPAEVPQTLLPQLKVAASMVIPVGLSSEQNLCRFVRSDEGYQKETFEAVRFVPLLTGKVN